MLAQAVVTNAFTVDVEEHFHVAALKRAFDPADWPNQRSRVVANTQRILALLDEAQVRGTFFVLGCVAERQPQLVRDIVAQGHELACHGFSHQLIYQQEPEIFRQETLRAKKVLEDIAGVAVIGYRAASYSITPASVWALDTISEAGFEYDSSIVPVRHDFYGFAGMPDTPYKLRLPNGAMLNEFPPSTIVLAGRRIPIAGGGYFRIFPYWFSRWGLQSLNSERKAFSFYVHPWEVDPEQPRVKTSIKSRFRHYTNLSKCEPRLRQLLSDFSFSTMQSVLDGASLPTYSHLSSQGSVGA